MKINDRHVSPWNNDSMNRLKWWFSTHIKNIIIYLIISLGVGWMTSIHSSSIPLILLIVVYMIIVFVHTMNRENDKIMRCLLYGVLSILIINFMFMYPKSLIVNPVHDVYVVQTETVKNQKNKLLVSVYDTSTKKLLGDMKYNYGEEQLVEKLFKNTNRAQIVYKYQFPFVFNEELKFFDR